MLSRAWEAGSQGVSPKCGLSQEGSRQTSNFLKEELWRRSPNKKNISKRVLRLFSKLPKRQGWSLLDSPGRTIAESYK